MDEEKMLRSQKRKAGIVLICGCTLAMLWMVFFPFFYFWWLKCAFLPDVIYFPIEEFLALNAHGNSPYVFVGGFLISTTTLIWAFKLNGKPKKVYEYVFLVIIIIMLLWMLFPCLCRPKEVSRRARCCAALKEAYAQISLYADENGGKLPDSVVFPDFIEHPVNYLGKGRSLKEKKFVLFEDASRYHAGDLRHRMYSNGEIKQHYPWKER